MVLGSPGTFSFPARKSRHADPEKNENSLGKCSNLLKALPSSSFHGIISPLQFIYLGKRKEHESNKSVMYKIDCICLIDISLMKVAYFLQNGIDREIEGAHSVIRCQILTSLRSHL